MINLERRFLSCESRAIRMDGDADKGKFVSGYGAVYYREGDPSTEFELIPGYLIERFAPGCFDQALQEDDIRCLFNHDPSLILGRNRSRDQTLQLRSDSTGLFYRCNLPETSVGKDLSISLDRGDVTGSSIGMIVHDEQVIREEDAPTIRLITRAGLLDVSPVTYPAYEGTSASNRSVESVLEELKQREDSSTQQSVRKKKIRQLRSRILKLSGK